MSKFFLIITVDKLCHIIAIS